MKVVPSFYSVDFFSYTDGPFGDYLDLKFSVFDINVVYNLFNNYRNYIFLEHV